MVEIQAAIAEPVDAQGQCLADGLIGGDVVTDHDLLAIRLTPSLQTARWAAGQTLFLAPTQNPARVAPVGVEKQEGLRKARCAHPAL